MSAPASKPEDPALAVPFDVVVIGGGINGVGIAREAASRGLRVVLLEKDDICSGVSAWSGRLVHGGLRYLEHRDFGLVRESLKERERLFRLAPHLVEPVPVLMPFYAHNRRPAWLIRLGMIAYDLLSWDKAPPRHRILSRKEVLRRMPGLDPDGLTGAALFMDGQVEYAERLCVELAVAARADGAVIRTRAHVDQPILEQGRVTGVSFKDTSTGRRHEVHGSVVLNVAGPWIDRTFTGNVPPQPRLNGGTKGSHVIVDPFPGAPSDVVYYESKSDGRLVLIIPWMGRYLVGCTDLRFEGDPGQARAGVEEVDYLLTEVNRLIPEAGLTRDSALYVYSGVRPLPYAPDLPESSVPRSHVLHDHGTGLENLITVIGGKLTTYRQLAEEAVDESFRRLGRSKRPSVTAKLPLPGARVANLDALQRELEAKGGLTNRTAARLVDLYGGRALQVWALGAEKPELLEVFHEASAAIGAELVFAVEQEMAVSLADVFARRMLLAFDPGHGLESVEAAAAILGNQLGWDSARRAAEIAEYHRWLDHLRVHEDGAARERQGRVAS